MAVRVVILRDIQLWPNGHIFTKRCSSIEYDAKNPKAKKVHQLIYQQGDRYGTVGDCCEYLTHEKLLELEAAGHIRTENKKRLRWRKPNLAEILYEAFRRSVTNSNGFEIPAWNECPPEVQKRWEGVADAAKEWAYENIQWQE